MPIASLFRSPPLGLYSESSDNSFQPPTAREDGICLSGLHIEPFICGRVRLLMPDCRTSQQSLICMRRKRVQLELARQQCQMQTGQMWLNQWRSFHWVSKGGVTTLFFVEHLAQATLKISRLAWLAATAWGTWTESICFVCACVYVYIHASGVCVCVCKPQIDISYPSQLFSTFFLEQGLSLNLEHAYLARSKQTQGSACLLIPSRGVCTAMPGFYMGSGDQTRVLMLAWQALSLKSSLSRHIYLF